ncbi:MAG: hypothetical protein NTY80_00615 [candidate division SR1 bacterium]|nr:hypothetical protein [candidate division SR1 bacterium]
MNRYPLNKYFPLKLIRKILIVGSEKDPHPGIFNYHISMKDLEKEIEQIKERNQRVEADKARETSISRKIIIMLLTYAVIIIFLYTAKLPNPRINAIVPTLGFMLSTLGLSAFKKIRIKKFK